jgi:hypothetical protein
MGTANTLKCKGTGNTNTVQCCSDPEQKKINMQKIKKLLPTYLFFFSSSSFIKPPATGHHQWTGAKGIYRFFFLQKITFIQLHG